MATPGATPSHVQRPYYLPLQAITSCLGLRRRKFEHGNDADSSGLACVLGKARVAPRLLGVDAVAFSTGQFADGHLVCLGSAFGTAVTGGGQVVVPVGAGGGPCLGCEDGDDVRLGVVREVHHRVDVLPPALAAAVMHQDQRSALEVPANPALVRSELRDGLRVPVERVAHVELLSFTVPGYALGRGDGRPDRRSRRSGLWPGTSWQPGRDMNPRPLGYEDSLRSAFRYALARAAPARCADRNCPALSSAAAASSRIG